jgi:hypothetical protein
MNQDKKREELIKRMREKRKFNSENRVSFCDVNGRWIAHVENPSSLNETFIRPLALKELNKYQIHSTRSRSV